MSRIGVALHDFLTARVARPIYEWSMAARPSRRTAASAYFQGLRFRTVSLKWSADQRDAWVLGALRRAARHAYETTPYWRETFDGCGFDPRDDFTFDDWARLPVLRRATVQDRLGDMVSTAIPSPLLQPNATGGSTGAPVRFFIGPEEVGWRRSGAEHSMRRIGVRQGIRRAMLWGHHLDPIARDRWTDRVLDAASNRRWFDCLRLSPEKLGRYHSELERYQPRCIIAYASALASLAEFLEAQGIEPTYPTRCFVTGAEKLYDHQRATVERVFNKPIHERYGGRDIGDVGFQHDASSRSFDVDWALVLVEPETDGQEGPILITKLHGDGMPMLRYAVDDWATFPASARPGHPTYTLTRVLGRSNDRVLLPNGGWVHGIHFPHLFKEFPLRDYQVRQARDYTVTALVVPARDFEARHLEGIEANLRANLPEVDVRVQVVDDIERSKANKWRPVVSEVAG